MATRDDTSKPSRRRGKSHPRTAEEPASTVEATTTADPFGVGEETQPRDLKEAVENVRKLLMQIRATLHCLSEVLMYSDDNDATLHAEVAQAMAAWTSYAAVELDWVKLKPLIEKLRQSGSAEPEESAPTSTSSGLYQVREPTPVYWAADTRAA